MEDNDLHQLSSALDNESPVIKFPDELEKQYVRHHVNSRLMISNKVLFIGMSAFLLFIILDHIVFPFPAAVTAWIIRVVTTLIIVMLVFMTRSLGDMNMSYVIVSATMIIVNTAVVSIDLIGVNSAGYDLPLGSLFVIIFSSTLIRFPFMISLLVISLMVMTQFAGLLLFTTLGMMNIVRIFLFYNFFIMIMLIFSNYTIDTDSRKMFLLNMFRRNYERSGLKKINADRYAALLDDYMRNDKPYLDPDLRIDDVARILEVKRHHLTQIINEKYNKNFFMYVNEFRIHEAQKMMSDKNNYDKTILRIAFDTGFNSKATFNRMFNAITGKTPTNIRKNQ